jgi:hypothetical protein
VVPGQWYHVALVRNGTTTTLYVNGTLFTSGTSVNANDNSNELQIGSPAGFISNVRLIKGTALYTSNFLVPAAPLTNVTNTSLLALRSSLTGDASNNNFTLTTTGTPRLDTNMSPFNSASTASNQFLSTALAYQTVQNAFNPSLSLGQGHNNFTADAWVYLTATPPVAPGWYIMQKGVNSTPGLEWSFGVTSTGLYFQTASGIPTGTTTSTAFTANTIPGQWMHLAITKVGTSVHIWFNGFYTGTVNGVNNLLYSASVASYVTIANSQTGATTAFNGFISNARIVYGIAAYTPDVNTRFTPSTSPLTTTQSLTSTTAAIGNASSYVVENGSSVLFNNTNDFLTFPEPANTTGDVTIEAWVLLSVAPTTRGWIINNSTTGTGHFGVAIEANRTITVWSDSNASAVLTSSLVSVPLGTWTHIAVVFVNGIITIFANGIRENTTVAKTTAWGASPVGTIFIGRQASAAAQYFPGYITNLRMVYGTAVYTTKFNVPTSPLTAITNTVFLGLRSSVTLDSSTTNAIITRGSGSTGLLLSPMTSPFTTYIPSVSNGYSLAFGWQSGASPTDFLQANTGYGLSTQLPGDFTIESWFYMAVLPASWAGIIDTRTVAADAGYYFGVASNGTCRFGSSNADVITSTTVLAINTWYHLAITRLNGVIRLWINGVQETTTVASTSDFGVRTQSVLSIGRAINPFYWSGYLSNFRLIIGTAVYTGTFTPDTSPFGLTTSSGTNKLAVNGITTYPAVANPTGTTYSGSVYFGGGASSFVSLPNSGRFFLEAYDFTIEAWIYNTSTTTATNKVIVGYGSTADFVNYSFQFIQITPTSTTTKFIFYPTTGFSSGGAVPQITSNTVSFNGNQWYHVAVTRSGATISFYLNGVSLGLDPTSPTLNVGQMLSATSTLLTIGSGSAGQSPYFGYISNVRLFRGYAIYTGNFTPPTTALTNTQASGTNIIALNNPIPSLGNSVYFGGSDYMRASASTTAMTTGDFTIETYYYPTSFAAVTTLFGQYTAATTALGYWNVQVTTAGIITVYYNGSTNFTASTAIRVNEWFHIALVRVSGTITLYVNGVSFGTVSFATQFGLATLASPLFIGATQLAGPTQYAVGYMSNLRIVKGVGVYTGAFTVPAYPLEATQSSTSGSVSITGTQTALLSLQNATTTDSSSNNFTLTATGSPTVSTTITPFLTQATNYSASFNGSTRYLALGGQSAFAFGSGDFTIELWVNPTARAGQASQIYDTRPLGTASASSYQVIGISSTGVLSYSGTVFTSGGTVPLNQWSHIAVSRQGTSTKLFLNGTQVGTTLTDTTSYIVGASRPTIATDGNNPLVSNFTYTGFISNLRVVKGTAVYTGNFTVPTNILRTTQSASTNITALTGTETSLLTLQSSTIVDTSINAFTLTNIGSVTTSTTSPTLYNLLPANGSSVQFTGSTQYLNAPSNAVFTFGTGDFTIEGWIYLNSATTSGTLFDNRTGSSTLSPQIYIDSGVVNYAVSGASVIAGATLSTTIWYHVAVVKISGSTKLYVNGVQSGSTYTDSNNYVIGSPFIGTGFGSSNPLSGYISNLRVVKGVGAYTATFSPSTTPLLSTQSSGVSAITGTSTSLLLYQDSPFTDNSTYNTIITPFGTPQYSPVFSPSYFSYPTPENANSGFFNGTSSFLSLTQPSNASTNDFTIEMWVYPTSIAAIGYLLSTSTTTTNSYHLWIAITGAVTLAVDSATASITSVTPSFARTNTWTHIAVTRTSGVIYLFVNGQRQTTTLSKATQFGDTGVLNIGRYQPTPGQYFTGYITNIRFVYGTPAVYTGTYITPPYSTPLTAITNTTLLLLQTTLTKDNSTNNVTITNTGTILSTYTNPYTMMKLPTLLTAQYSKDLASTTGIRDNSMYNGVVTINSTAITNYISTVSPFGITPTLLLGQSSLTRDNSINNYQVVPNSTPNIMPYVTPFNGDAIAFNGTTQYITGTSLLNSLGGDFTIEFFMMAGPQTSAIGSLLLSRNAAYSPASTNNYYIMCEHILFSQQTISIHKVNLGGFFLGATPVCDSKWHHIAIVRINNIVKVYVDGLLDPSVQNSFSNNDIWDYSNYTIGSNPSDGGSTVAQLAYNGMLSNLRIINGVGIYTGAFTPPTSNLTTSQSSGTGVVAYTATTPSSTGNSLITSSINSGFYINGTFGLNLYLNDYTIEFYHFLTGRPLTVSTTPCFFSNYQTYQTGSISMFAGHSSGDTTKYQIAFDGLAYSTTNWMQSVTSVIYGRWTHIAVVRRSGVTYLYINGILDSTSGTGNYNIISSTSTAFRWYIGSQGGSGTSYLSGYMSNFRVVNGVAVYNGTNTSISNFTVPTSSLSTTQSSGTNIAALSNSLVSNGGAIQIMPNISGGQSIAYSILPPGTYDWTVEGYVFLNSLPTVNTWAAGSMVYFSSSSASVSDGIHCVIGQTELYVAVTNVKYGTNILHGMSLYTWYHLAYVKISNIIYFYVNGAKLGSVAVPTNGTATASYIGTATTAATYAVNGYVSNLRVTRLLGLYTDTFPALTSPLATTQSSVTTVNAVSSANTSLLALQNSLIADASTNNFILTTNGSVSLITTVGPRVIVTNGNSVYFNGTTDYIQLPLNSAIAMAPTGTFTIEAWVYSTNISSAPYIISNWYFGIATNCSWSFFLTASGYLGFNYGIGASNLGVTGTSIQVAGSTWTHVAVTRDANNIIRLYVNGVADATTATVVGTLNTNIQGVRIGSSDSATHGWLLGWQGYISNVRFVNGICVYTGNFAIPPGPLETTQNSNTNIATIPSNPFPAAGHSVGFDGTGDYLSVASNTAVNLGTSNFTIESWCYFTSLAVVNGIWFNGTLGSDNSRIQLALLADGTLRFYGQPGAVTNALLCDTSAGVITANTWYHIACTYVSSTRVGKIYVNGVLSATATSTQALDNINTFYIGTARAGATAVFTRGYISNFRIVKSQVLYTDTFTPSTTPLTATSQGAFASNVSILTAQSLTIVDNSFNAFTITPVGDAATRVVSPFHNGTGVSLLMVRNSTTTDNGIYGFTGTLTGAPVLNTSEVLLMPPLVDPNGQSVFFNGATQYIVAQSDAAFAFSTGDFTIESWIYLVSGTTGTIFDSRTSSNSVHPVLYVSGTVRYKVAGTDVIVGSTLNISTWYHVALVRISNSTKLYVNGVQVGSTYADTNDYLIGSPDFGTGLNGENSLTGYLSNLRVIKGTGAYTDRFPNPNRVLSTSQSSVTPVQAITSPAANANSVFFNGTTDFLTATGGATFNFGTGDWTIECYAFSLSTANFRPLFNMHSGSYNILLRYNTNQWEFFRVNGLGTYITLSDANNAVNSWVHHAIVKRSGNIFWYINGTQVYTVANATNYVDTTLVIGGYGGYFWQGFISNFRVVKGVGVYTGNFTVPTSSLTITQSAGTNIAAIASGTLLLSLQNAVTNDASTNNYTLTANGAPALETTVSPFLPSAVMLLTAQSGLAVDNAVGFPITTQAGVAFQRTTTPFGVQTPTALLTLQGNVANVDVSSTNLTSIMVSLANTQTNTVFGPFNSDVPLLTFQDSIIIDNSNNRGQMTVVGAGVAPTDASPFTTTKGFTSLLIPYGYADISYANAFIANNANSALINSIYNPAVIPASLVSVLGLQTSNITLESSINNSTFTTS